MVLYFVIHLRFRGQNKPSIHFCFIYFYLWPIGPCLICWLFIYWPATPIFSSLCLYVNSSFTKTSNSSLRVSIVFYVSYLSCSLLSICVFNSFRSFLLSSSSCLHFSAFFRMFSLFEVFAAWFELLLFWLAFAACKTWPGGPPANPSEPVDETDPMSVRTRFLRFLKSATYCNSASLFFWSMFSVFSLQSSTSSSVRRERPISIEQKLVQFENRVLVQNQIWNNSGDDNNYSGICSNDRKECNRLFWDNFDFIILSLCTYMNLVV